MTPTRPVVRYHGGKWKLAPWIISYFPVHRVYVEPFGGAASVLLRKDRSHAEIYNDIFDEMVNLFRVIRDPEMSRELLRFVELTPFSRTEFNQAYELCIDPVEMARRTIIRAFMGFGTNSIAAIWKTGFRSNSDRSGSTHARDWANYPAGLNAIIDRFRAVVVENRPAVKVMKTHDAATTLHYVDPPYVNDTRGKHQYRHDMTDADHHDLAGCLHSLSGFVVLSGYRCELYDELFGDWRRVDRLAHADGARKRIESLWLNPACVDALDRQGSQLALFEGSKLEMTP